jgi:DNA-binding NtrC family response regulator
MTHRSEPYLTNCRVLIIEDEFLLGDDLARALRQIGVHVIGPIAEFSDAASVAHGDFDIAVIDVNLRGNSTYPIADAMMQADKVFIFTTGYGAGCIPEHFRHVTRWEKPYDLDKVTAEVVRLCRQRFRSHADA